MINIKNINPTTTLGILDLKLFSIDKPNLTKRLLEKAGSLYLLEKMLFTNDFNLNYNETNKPFLIGRSEHISISHSFDKLVIIINKTENTGVDIELIRDKILKIQHKFLSKEECGFALNNVEKLITIWAAKEAIYKSYGLKGIDFKNNIIIAEFDNSIIFGKIETSSFKKNYKLMSERVDEYKLVYILNEL